MFEKTIFKKEIKSIFVVFVLVGTRDGDVNVVSLFLGEDGEFSTEGLQVESSDLFVEFLGELVNFVFVFTSVSVGPEFDLGEGLVGEGVGHNKRGVTSSTT